MSQPQDSCQTDGCAGTLRVHARPTGRSKPGIPGHARLAEWRWDREFKCDGCGALYQADPTLTTLELVREASAKPVGQVTPTG